MELEGPIKAKEPTTVKGPTERKLIFQLIQNGCRRYLKLFKFTITGAYSNFKRKHEGKFFFYFFYIHLTYS